MALLLASRRWDTSTGIDYAAEAKKVLKAIATQDIFGKNPACVYFAQLSGNSDPSYVLPLFYTEWACFDADNAALWDAAATLAGDPAIVRRAADIGDDGLDRAGELPLLR
jgi:endo-1,4-beta-D-glucanase Y